MLHPAERKAGNQDQVIFGERKRLCEIVAEVSDPSRRHLLYLGRFLLSAGKLRLAHVQSWLVAFFARTAENGPAANANR